MKLLITRGPECFTWFEADDMSVKGSASKAYEFGPILADYEIEMSPELESEIQGMKPGEEKFVDGAKAKKKPKGFDEPARDVVATTGATFSGDGMGHTVANIGNVGTGTSIVDPLPSNGILPISPDGKAIVE